MSKAAQQLGRLLKPPSPLIGVTTGEVISTTPLMIRVGDKITGTCAEAILRGRAYF